MRPPPILQADYFDGHSAQARPVRLQVKVQAQEQGPARTQAGRRVLHIDGDGIALRIPVRQVSWPERQRHGARQAYLRPHGMLSHADPAAWDAWADASGVRTSLLVHAMQSWRGALLAALLLLAVLWGSWHWGVPAAGRGIVALLPASVDAQVGEVGLASLDRDWLRPSRLSAAQQAAVRGHWDAALARWAATPGAPPVPPWQLQFRRMPAPPGTARPAGGAGGTGEAAEAAEAAPGLANALALPGGTLVVTDALVQLLADRPDVLVGVLGHELGHVQHRHGMRALVQAGLLAAGSALLIGDVSQVLAAVPVLLGQAAYSRRFEFEADAQAAAMLRANGHDPAVFGLLFERLRQAAPADAEAPAWGIGLASHPPDAERLRRMVQAR